MVCILLFICNDHCVFKNLLRKLARKKMLVKLASSWQTWDESKLVMKLLMKKKFVNSFGQFHQHFMSAFVPLFLRQIKVQTKNVGTKKLCAKILYKKSTHKMLVKLTHADFSFVSIVCPTMTYYRQKQTFLQSNIQNKRKLRKFWFSHLF